MKKSVWKVAVLIVLLIFLVSCKGRVASGEDPRNTEAILKEVQSGTKGVEIEILPNFPPDILYDQNELIAIIDVKNKGNHNLEAQECFVQITGFDPNIIGSIFGVPQSCAGGIETLEGKNVFNTGGGFSQLEFGSSNVLLPDDILEYNPTLNFVTCYNYETKANPQICVDPAFYQVSTEQKTCRPSDVSMSGGHGAPVAVSRVNVDMVGNKAIFSIDIVNQGSGKVLHPDTDIRSCADNAQLKHTDLDKVRFNIDLVGGSSTDCKPNDGLVRLSNDKGKIVCTSQVDAPSAFETPLKVNLQYNYIQSQQKKIKIIRTPTG